MEKEKICNLGERKCFINQNIDSLQDMNLYEGGCPLTIQGCVTINNREINTRSMISCGRNKFQEVDMTGINYIDLFSYSNGITQEASLCVSNLGGNPITLTLLFGNNLHNYSYNETIFEHLDYSDIVIPAYTNKLIKVNILCNSMRLKYDSGEEITSISVTFLYSYNSLF